MQTAPPPEAPAGEPVPESYLRSGGLGFALALAVAAVGSAIVFHFLNRVQVEGDENIPEDCSNVLYCLNHNSILDNFAFESTIYMPRMIFRPEYLPVQLADRKNFFGDPHSRKLRDRFMSLVGKHFLRHLKAFPVDRDRGDLEQVEQWIELLQHNIVVVFPEGTRSRTGEIGHGKAGVGKLIYKARPTVIPVRMTGTDRILGVGRKLPRAFQTVRIRIGKPMDLSALLDSPLPEDGRERYRKIAETVVEAIKGLE